MVPEHETGVGCWLRASPPRAGVSMIFGFNTDVKHGDTVYHVQTEAQESDLLLQTWVFVGGRCIGKHSSSYAGQVSRPEFSDQHVHELLKEQHRSVLEAVREGRLQALLGTGN